MVEIRHIDFPPRGPVVDVGLFRVVLFRQDPQHDLPAHVVVYDMSCAQDSICPVVAATTNCPVDGTIWDRDYCIEHLFRRTILSHPLVHQYRAELIEAFDQLCAQQEG